MGACFNVPIFNFPKSKTTTHNKIVFQVSLLIMKSAYSWAACVKLEVECPILCLYFRAVTKISSYDG